MSKEWKNARAEAEMRKFDKENMAKAAQKRREEEIHGKWTVDVTTSGENAKELMEKIVGDFLILMNVDSPNISIEFHPVIEPNKKD